MDFVKSEICETFDGLNTTSGLLDPTVGGIAECQLRLEGREIFVVGRLDTRL